MEMRLDQAPTSARWWAVALLTFAVTWCHAAGGACAGSQREAAAASPEIFVTVLPPEGGAEGAAHLLIRELSPSTTEFDVISAGRPVVSMVSAIGAGSRAVCGAVYLDEASWFAYCELTDFPFSSPREFFEALPGCPGCSDIRGYFAAAHGTGCGPVLVGDAIAVSPSDWEREQVSLMAALEIQSWDEALRNSLMAAFRMVGAHGCPRGCPQIIDFLGLDVSGSVEEVSPSEVEEVPDELFSRLDHARIHGLDAWLDGLVADLP